MGFGLGTETAPYNGEGNCKSTAGEDPFQIQIDGSGKNKLTNLKSNKFTISEMEVWEIIYEKRSQSSKMWESLFYILMSDL